jgi:2-amino-4-hydroxy-6-hydroxymethyldihydropteridine diphosphokinase
MERDRIELKGLKVPCIIGVFDWERRVKQDVVLDLIFPARVRPASRSDDLKDATDYKAVAKDCIAFVSRSSHQLVETLAEDLTRRLFRRFGLAELELRVSKPGAVRGSKNVSVVVRRSNPRVPSDLLYLGLGSNIEPTLHLDRALAALDRRYSLLAISHVYRTQPVGGRKQPDYWNMAVGFRTGEKPAQVARFIAVVEGMEGRVRAKDQFIPRTLDLDILLWGERVTPHRDVLTRAHALFPLAEIAPALIHPVVGRPLLELAARFTGKGRTFRMLPAHTLASFPPAR